MPDLLLKKSRPVWYNLSPLNLPVPGLVSIFHRISGLLLVLGLMWLLYLLELSLGSEAGFQRLREYMSHPISKLGMLVMLWSFLHHLCAGIRYLLLDLHVGIALAAARFSSFMVFAISLVATAVLGLLLW
jgi:succinate dehydrogenase / fumarate reductase cytochrome b subunit